MAVQRGFAYPTIVPLAHPQASDREMRCEACGTRVFSSRAPELVRQHFSCPRCLGAVALVPDPPRSGFSSTW